MNKMDFSSQASTLHIEPHGEWRLKYTIRIRCLRCRILEYGSTQLLLNGTGELQVAGVAGVMCMWAMHPHDAVW